MPSTSGVPLQSALISPAELNDLLQNTPEQVAVLDASYAIGAGNLPPEAVFQQMRIGPAQFFDIDEIADRSNPLPHMLPSPDEFAEAVGRLGVGNEHLVVVYDQSGIIMAACRAWWMFRVFGHDKVRVLDGGLPAWQAAGFPVTTGTPEAPARRSFQSSFRPELVKSYKDMKQIVADGTASILDARPPERFAGTAPEPRPGLLSGHMPGALNIPAGSLIDPHARQMRSVAELAARFDELSLPGNLPIVTTCGSGVTACVVALALFETGHNNISVYDGSWNEWARQTLDSSSIRKME